MVLHLYKNSEEDDYNGSCDEESFLWEVINQEHEGEADGSSQASVGDDELISKGHGVPPELIHHSGQQENTFRGGGTSDSSVWQQTTGPSTVGTLVVSFSKHWEGF